MSDEESAENNETILNGDDKVVTFKDLVSFEMLALKTR